MTSLYSQAHITEEQKRLYSIEDYSRGFLFFSDAITDLVNENQFSGILDYGSGLALLSGILKFDFPINYFPYDPAIPEFAERPQPKPLTLAINSLEYCEPQYLNNIISDLSSLTEEFCFVAINTRKPGEIMPKIVESNEWWLNKMTDVFDFSYYRQVGYGFVLIGKPLLKTTNTLSNSTGIINAEHDQPNIKSVQKS